MPPDLFGNIEASSAWMLFCNAPKQIEMLHSATAPPVPSALIDEPSAAIRKPGFASATTKPSHHVIALRSCLSSTSAYAIGPPLAGFPKQNSYQLVQAGRRSSTTPAGRRQSAGWAVCIGQAGASAVEVCSVQVCTNVPPTEERRWRTRRGEESPSGASATTGTPTGS